MQKFHHGSLLYGTQAGVAHLIFGTRILSKSQH